MGTCSGRPWGSRGCARCSSSCTARSGPAGSICGSSRPRPPRCSALCGAAPPGLLEATVAAGHTGELPLWRTLVPSLQRGILYLLDLGFFERALFTQAQLAGAHLHRRSACARRADLRRGHRPRLDPFTPHRGGTPSRRPPGATPPPGLRAPRPRLRQRADRRAVPALGAPPGVASWRPSPTHWSTSPASSHPRDHTTVLQGASARWAPNVIGHRVKMVAHATREGRLLDGPWFGRGVDLILSKGADFSTRNGTASCMTSPFKWLKCMKSWRRTPADQDESHTPWSARSDKTSTLLINLSRNEMIEQVVTRTSSTHFSRLMRIFPPLPHITPLQEDSVCERRSKQD